MAYSVSKSKFLDIIDRACNQLNIVSCKDIKANFSLRKIELDTAKSLDISKLDCIETKNSVAQLDVLWSQKFPDTDNTFRQRYDEIKLNEWDKIKKLNEINHLNLVKQVDNIKNVINNDTCSDSEKVDKVGEALKETKKVFSNNYHQFLDEVSKNITQNYIETKNNDLENYLQVILQMSEFIYIKHISSLREKVINMLYESFVHQLGHLCERTITRLCSGESELITPGPIDGSKSQAEISVNGETKYSKLDLDI